MSPDIYICSTLRHLLFSLSRAQAFPKRKSLILFFVDYQNIDKEQLSTLTPENIEIKLMSRGVIKQHLKGDYLGKLISIASLRDVALSRTLRSKVCNYIENTISLSTGTLSKSNLFLFNDKNKMARLFKLAKPNYEVIEDGVGNYYHIPHTGIKKHINPLNLKGDNFWVMGDNIRCNTINAVFPDNLPLSVKHKGKKIDFLDKKEHLKTINQVFKFKPVIGNDNKSIIIATQPISKKIIEKTNDRKYFLRIHRTIADHFESLGINYYIKLHPSEQIEDYLPYFELNKFLSVKHPLELELMNSHRKLTVASINSTAGLGFESFCTRKKLIKDEEMGLFSETLLDWFNNPEQLSNRVKETYK